MEVPAADNQNYDPEQERTLDREELVERRRQIESALTIARLTATQQEHLLADVDRQIAALDEAK